MRAAGVAPGRDPAWPSDALEVGRIVDAWGVKGWIKVQPFSSDPQALLAASQWFLRPPDDGAAPAQLRSARQEPSFPSSLKIVEARPHGDFIVATARAIDDRSAAEALRGARLFISRAQFPASGEDEYYWVDLIGLEVRNREGVVLGSVVGLLDTGPHSVLKVQPPGNPGSTEVGEERLIPFVAAYVDTVDLPGRRITVDWGTDF